MSIEMTRIGELRREQGITIAKMSQDIGLSISAISNYERGTRNPDAYMIVRFAEYFNCTADYLLGLSEYRNKEEKILLEDELREIQQDLKKLPASEQIVISHFIGDAFLTYFNAKEYSKEHALKKPLAKYYIKCLESITSMLFESVQLLSPKTRNNVIKEQRLLVAESDAFRIVDKIMEFYKIITDELINMFGDHEDDVNDVRDWDNSDFLHPQGGDRTDNPAEE